MSQELIDVKAEEAKVEEQQEPVLKEVKDVFDQFRNPENGQAPAIYFYDTDKKELILVYDGYMKSENGTKLVPTRSAVDVYKNKGESNNDVILLPEEKVREKILQGKLLFTTLLGDNVLELLLKLIIEGSLTPGYISLIANPQQTKDVYGPYLQEITSRLIPKKSINEEEMIQE